jgi:hypothetical protein
MLKMNKERETTMNVKLDLKPEVEARLTAQAQAQGVSLDTYLTTLIERYAEGQKPMTSEERAQAFQEWAENHPKDTPLLSDEAISRQSIYGERG